MRRPRPSPRRLVALIALATIVTLATSKGPLPGPGRIYGDGVGRVLTVIIGKEHFVFAATFGAMAFSTFVFDTLARARRRRLRGVRGRGCRDPSRPSVMLACRRVQGSG